MSRGSQTSVLDVSKKVESVQKSLERLTVFFGLRLRFPFVGLAFSHCWLFCTPRVVGAYVSPYFSATLYMGFAVAMLAFALASRRLGYNLSTHAPMAAVCLTLGVASTFFLVSGLFVGCPFGVEVACAVLCGCGIGWSYLIWGAYYSELTMRQAVLVLFCTMAVGSLLKIPFALLPLGWPTGMLFGLLPIASFACQRVAVKGLSGRRAPSNAFDTPEGRSLLRLYACGVAMFGVAIGINRSANVGFFNPTVALAVSHLLEVAVAFGVIWYVYRQREELEFSTMWMLVLVVSATGLVVAELPFAAAGPISLAVLSAAHMLLVVFYWLSLTDVACHTDVLSDVLFGLGWPIYLLPMAATSFVGVALAPIDASMRTVVIYAMLLSVFFFMRKRPHGIAPLFDDLNVSSLVQENSLAARVHGLAERCGLTAREEEVALLYAQGRSRGFISGELVLSEHTVRDHISHIFKKLGIHNKQELIDLLNR